MHSLWVDGRNMRDFGIYVSGDKSFNSAEYDYERISVPGRNGDLLISNKCFKNIQVPYKVGITKDFAANAAAVRSFLLLNHSYRRIEDSYSTDTFRMGFFAGPVDFDMQFLNRAGESTLVFDCKPQRFLKSGEFPVDVKNGGQLMNEWHPAKPVIVVKGTGAADIRVGASQIHISEIGGSITLDCDVLNADDGRTNKNNQVTIRGGWPVLEHGDTQITWSGGIQSVTITPHWWMP